MSRFRLALKAFRELGPKQLWLYGIYQFGLRSGKIGRGTAGAHKVLDHKALAFKFSPVFGLPETEKLTQVLGPQGQRDLLAGADEILAGRVRLFGGEPVPLELAPHGPLAHWTRWAPDDPHSDIKYIWEPARFGWATTLGRAYYLSGEERYAAAFWTFAETFLEANPPYLGPNWVSAQEAALRLLAFIFALQAFGGSRESTPQREERLSQAIAVHAARIPPTLAYARAQNNNHLLTEAVGLYSAGCALHYHPEALEWRRLGWRWFNYAIQEQFDLNGAYMQNSSNYQRLALQAALWMRRLASAREQNFPPATNKRLAAATGWLAALLDPISGRLPNLGPNDGAYILPLTVCPFHDYRPALAAAGAAFANRRYFGEGAWDEMTVWLVNREKGIGDREEVKWKSERAGAHFSISPVHPSTAPHILRNNDSWAYLRVAHFSDRPGHADQLHLDLWRRGLNIAQDPGTYRYNAPPPWDNALTHTAVHNTVTVDGAEQMTPAGRFLYLDWAQAEVLEDERSPDGDHTRLVAQHNGYRRLGVLHQRGVAAAPKGGWLVEDGLTAAGGNSPLRIENSQFSITLNWLLQDWPWEVEEIGDQGIVIRVESPDGPIILELSAEEQQVGELAPAQLQIVRAGELVYGRGEVSPTWGWISATYGVKMPALAIRLTVEGALPIKLVSKWSFPDG